MIVVMTAMSTRIVNSAWSSTLRLTPTLKMTSSVRPRLFIKTPSALDLRPLSPWSRAALAAPANLPTMATKRTPSSTSNPFGPSWVTFALSPVTTKKTGRSNRRLTCSRRSRISRNISAVSCRVMMTPKRKAPKMTWRPIHPVTKAEPRNPAITMAKMLGVSRPARR